MSSSLAERWLQALYESPLLFSGILDSRGHVLEGNRLAIEGCGLVRDEIIGRPFWQGGWWRHDEELSDHIRALVLRVIATDRVVRVTTRYFADQVTVRVVDLILQPVLDEHPSGIVHTYVVATGLDITDGLRARAEAEEKLTVETTGLQEEILVRGRALESATKAADDLKERVIHLAAVAMHIARAETVDEVTSIVFKEAFPAIGAEGGAILVREPNELRVYLSEHMDDFVRSRYGEAPPDSPLPGRAVARTGKRLVLPNRAAGLAYLPEMAQVYDITRRLAWVYEPLQRGGELLGSLAVSWTEEREFSPGELSLIEAMATQCAQAIERIKIAELNREAAAQIAHMVESVQRSLLTSSPTPSTLDIATRYIPAAQAVQVGGDWFDSFTTETGSTLLIVGDVAGHDGDAMASMAQLRNLLRGIALSGGYGPAALLAQLDSAIVALELNLVATVVIAELVPGRRESSEGASREAAELRWASAGHLPPVLRTPEGNSRLLAGGNDLLLGANHRTERHEYVTEFPPGTSVILYTDGLIERRGQHLDDGFVELVSACSGDPEASAESLCAELLHSLVVGPPGDDVVLLVAVRRP